MYRIEIIGREQNKVADNIREIAGYGEKYIKNDYSRNKFKKNRVKLSYSIENRIYIAIADVDKGKMVNATNFYLKCIYSFIL